ARGDVLAHPMSRPEVADQFTANVIWMSADPMLPGRSYLMKIGTRTIPASITDLKHRLDHLDRPADQHDRRRRHDRSRPAASDQRPLAGPHRHARGARAAQAPEA